MKLDESQKRKEPRAESCGSPTLRSQRKGNQGDWPRSTTNGECAVLEDKIRRSFQVNTVSATQSTGQRFEYKWSASPQSRLSIISYWKIQIKTAEGAGEMGRWLQRVLLLQSSSQRPFRAAHSYPHSSAGDGALLWSPWAPVFTCAYLLPHDYR